MITIKQKDLRAVSIAMATKDIRYYLIGVHVEWNGAETVLAGTDGHRMHIIRNELSSIVREPVSFIMPAEMVKKCLKARAPRSLKVSPEISLSYDAASGKIEALLPDGSSIIDKAIDGRFPDFRRVIAGSMKDPEESAPVVFNADYLKDASDAVKVYWGKTSASYVPIGVRPMGAAAGVLCVEELLIIIMPMRGELSPLPAPFFSEYMQKPEPLRAVA